MHTQNTVPIYFYSTALQSYNNTAKHKRVCKQNYMLYVKTQKTMCSYREENPIEAHYF